MLGRDIREVFEGDHINIFIQVAMEEGIIDIELENGQKGSCSHNKKDLECDHLGYWRKNINIVEAFNLIITLSHQKRALRRSTEPSECSFVL